jgi:hypothetical protein
MFVKPSDNTSGVPMNAHTIGIAGDGGPSAVNSKFVYADHGQNWYCSIRGHSPAPLALSVRGSSRFPRQSQTTTILDRRVHAEVGRPTTAVTIYSSVTG